MELTIDEFAGQARHWYDIYASANPRYFGVERELSAKVELNGYLEMADLVAITGVLGNPHGMSGRLQKRNSGEEVIHATHKAMEALESPADALEAVRVPDGWGLTYGSKTLRCMRPRDFGALDSVIMNGVRWKQPLPRDDGRKYSQAIDLYRQIRDRIKDPGPRQNGAWYIADVEMALFQFLWGGTNRLIV